MARVHRRRAGWSAGRGRRERRARSRTIRPLRRAATSRGPDRRARRARARPGPRPRDDPPAFREGARPLLRDFVGRPTPLYAARLSERGGHRVYLKREDLPTPAPTRSTTRSARRCSPGGWASAGHRRDRRGTARRRHRHRLRPARPRVRRLHGHGGHAPPGAQRRADAACWAPRSCRSRPARTLKEAVSAAIRDWVTNVATPTTSSARPSARRPTRRSVRDLQR